MPLRDGNSWGRAAGSVTCCPTESCPRGWQGSKGPWELPEASWDTGIQQSIPFAVSSNRLCQKQPLNFLLLTKEYITWAQNSCTDPSSSTCGTNLPKNNHSAPFCGLCKSVHSDRIFYLYSFNFLFLLLLASTSLPVVKQLPIQWWGTICRQNSSSAVLCQGFTTLTPLHWSSFQWSLLLKLSCPLMHTHVPLALLFTLLIIYMEHTLYILHTYSCA